ncbi:MAG: ATP synthase F1 subunit gamma [Bacteroidales bacterium]|jgi:F-type H+-transporting ATPase subunit gamma|nr:ATP synthase F1 subunit gamma [Bacteroidales bacterium]MBR4491965.1 ATP synthase F1 subunit gamma [Bacteroidales bacterium]MBR4512084.1 ATP synthase F1 subunit gamma [Bacteroidales bacterium]MBR6919067.1 ATP synthase F1 subunit gamma [Bacteroidales bacterium]
MANLKDIRVRMASVESTQKITSAMKMVSAAKLRRAQNTILKLRPYANELSAILADLMSTQSDGDANPLEEVRAPERVVLVVITSNKGLCGGFNNNVLKRTEALLASDYRSQMAAGNVRFIGIGKKANEYLRRKKYPLLSSHESILDACTFQEAAGIAEGLMQQFVRKEIDKVEIVYNKFKNAATQILTHEQYLPVCFSPDAEEPAGMKHDFIFEPSREVLYQQLVPSMTKMKFYQSLLESIAAEHGARMTAMHKATENASELTKQLNLTYNKLRQAAITNELIEMVSGAESLKNA